MQVQAVKAQTDAVRQQNAHLISESRRKLARDGITAIRLLDGVLTRLKEDIARLSRLLEQPQYSKPDAVAPLDWKTLVRKPPLSIVWDNLGVCGSEIVDKYLLLDARIDEFEENGISGAHYMKNALADFTNIVNLLRNELKREEHALTQTSQEGV